VSIEYENSLDLNQKFHTTKLRRIMIHADRVYLQRLTWHLTSCIQYFEVGNLTPVM